MLPRDIIVEISTYLYYSDLLTLCSLNKQLRSLFGDDNFWKQLCQRLPLLEGNASYRDRVRFHHIITKHGKEEAQILISKYECWPDALIEYHFSDECLDTLDEYACFNAQGIKRLLGPYCNYIKNNYLPFEESIGELITADFNEPKLFGEVDKDVVLSKHPFLIQNKLTRKWKIYPAYTTFQSLIKENNDVVLEHFQHPLGTYYVLST